MARAVARDGGKSRPNVSPKRFQVSNHIKVLSVVGRAEDHGVTMGDLQPAQISMSQCFTPLFPGRARVHSLAKCLSRTSSNSIAGTLAF